MTGILTGLRIRERRRELGLKQVELAQNVGISPSYLNLIERNRRKIGGGLLMTIARELGLHLDQLDGSSERRLRDRLMDMAEDPALMDERIPPAKTDELIARMPEWANLSARTYVTLLRERSEAEALRDRLAHDPALSDAVHAMLTETTTLRSIAEILDSDDQIDDERRRRFKRILREQATQLSTTSSSLASYFDEATNMRRESIPRADAEEFLFRYRQDLGKLVIDIGGIARQKLGGTVPAMELLLRSNHQDFNGYETPPAGPENHDDGRWESLNRLLCNHLRGSSVMEPISRYLELTLPEVSVVLDPDATKPILMDELVQMVADEVRAPIQEFATRAKNLAWRVEPLIRAHDADNPLVFRRIAAAATAGGPPVAHLVSDLSGRLIHRGGTLDLLSRARQIDCPKWPVFEMARGNGVPVVKRIQLSGGEERVALALGRPGSFWADMLIWDAQEAERLGLWPESALSEDLVGSDCRICAHNQCEWRREASVI
ncbi:MAG: helix-turn-helix transcriptional regulator [Alphaproteobacteria bacterium]